MSSETQRTKGGRELLDLLLLDVAEIRRHLDTANRNIRANPGLCSDEIGRASRNLLSLERRIKERVDPMLMRRAAKDAETNEVRDLKETLKKAIEALKADPPNVSRLKRDA